MNLKHYILDENKHIVAVGLMTWAKWFEGSNRHVGQDTIGKSRVYTVFLGIDHNFGEGPPVLWETMVFGGKLDQSCDRCAGGWEQAEAMHAKWVEKVREAEPIGFHSP